MLNYKGQILNFLVLNGQVPDLLYYKIVPLQFTMITCMASSSVFLIIKPKLVHSWFFIAVYVYKIYFQAKLIKFKLTDIYGNYCQNQWYIFSFWKNQRAHIVLFWVKNDFQHNLRKLQYKSKCIFNHRCTL